MKRILRALAACLLATVTACAPPPTHVPSLTMAPVATAAGQVATSDRLLGLGARDWSLSRFGGASLTRARAATPTRHVQSFGDAAAWAGGLALSDAAFGVTGTATNGPAWAYRSPVARLVGRVWFVTTTGWLLGLATDDPKNTSHSALKTPIAISLGHPCTQAVVTLSDDGLRAYVVTDDGRIVLSDLATGAVLTDLPIDSAAPAAPSIGMAACLDPTLCDATSARHDVLFAGTNAGRFRRFIWDGTTLTGSGEVSGVPADAPSNAVRGGPVAIDGTLYYGDREGYFHVLTFDQPASASNPSSTFLGTSWPVETPVALDLDDSLTPTAAFVAVGTQLAWVDLSRSPAVVTLSPRLLVDAPVGAAPLMTSGRLSDFQGLYQGTSLMGLPPVEAASALVGAAGAALPGGDLVGGRHLSVRTGTVGAADRLDGESAALSSVYGAGSETGGDLGSPIGLAMGPAGDLYLGGKDGVGGHSVTFVPAVPTAPRWGYTAAQLMALGGVPTFLPGHAYVLGAGASPTIDEPHDVAYDDGGTPTYDSDDCLWIAEWHGNRVRRLGIDGRAQVVLSSATPAAGPHLARPHGVAVAAGVAGRPVFICQADSPELLRLDPATGAVSRVARLGSASLADLAYGQGPNDGVNGTLYVASRDGHTVYAVDPVTGAAQTFAGTGDAGRSPEGTPAAQAALDAPEAVAVDDATGDVYIGEAGGRRLKVVRAAGAQAGRLVTIAGNGAAGFVGESAAAADAALGWISGLCVGPADLADPTHARAGAVYLVSREVPGVLRLPVAASRVEGSLVGLMRWDLSRWAGQLVLAARVGLTVAETMADGAPRPDLVLAEATSPGNESPWTPEALAPDSLPERSGIAAVCPAVSTTSAPAWQAGDRLSYDLPAASLPTDGRLALALVPGVDSPFVTHDAASAGFLADAVNRLALRFEGVSAATPAAARPRLDVTVSPYRLDHPIMSPPALFADGSRKLVFVANTNTLFRLDFSSPASFASDATFSVSRLGRGTEGPLDTRTGSGAFIADPTCPLLTFSGLTFMIDRKPRGGTWDFGLNKYVGLDDAGPTYVDPPDSCRIDGQTVPSDVLNTGTYATYDGFGNDFGAVYFGLGNGRVYRLAM